MSDLVIEVYEYLEAGVSAVMHLLLDTMTAVIYHQDSQPVPFASEATLTLPDILPGLSVPVKSFFE